MESSSTQFDFKDERVGLVVVSSAIVLAGAACALMTADDGSTWLALGIGCASLAVAGVSFLLYATQPSQVVIDSASHQLVVLSWRGFRQRTQRFDIAHMRHLGLRKYHGSTASAAVLEFRYGNSERPESFAFKLKSRGFWSLSSSSEVPIRVARMFVTLRRLHASVRLSP